MDEQDVLVTGSDVPSSVIDQIYVLLGYDPKHTGSISISTNAPKQVEVTTWPRLFTRDTPNGVRYLNDEKTHFVRAYVTHRIVSDSLINDRESK